MDSFVGKMWNFALWLTVVICVDYIINLNRKSTNAKQINHSTNS